jgi:hypothetical protein
LSSEQNDVIFTTEQPAQVASAQQQQPAAHPHNNRPHQHCNLKPTKQQQQQQGEVRQSSRNQAASQR